MADTKLSALTQGTVGVTRYAVDSGGASKKFYDQSALDVRDFGADPTGGSDSGPAIQLAFDEAFGTVGSPHGVANKKLNRPVYIPRGEYDVGAPLYLNKVASGRIYGDGSNCTRLQYTGSLSAGNVVAQGTLSGGDWTTVKAITPLIITDGFANSSISGLNLVIGGGNTCCFYLFWNGAGGAGPTQNIFTDILTENAATGYLIGYLTPGLCSEQLFLNCTGTNHASYAFRNVSANALNNVFVCCGAASNGVGFSCPTGNINIIGASLYGNNPDITTGQLPMTVVEARTESANFIDLSASQTWVHITGSVQSNNVSGAGYFAKLGGSNSCCMIDACVSENTGATAGLITGTTSRLWLRGNDFRNASFLSSYSGAIVDYGDYYGTVSQLPTASAALKGVRRFVTDATVTTFASTVAGGGSNNVPVYCDGSNWKIG